MEAMIGGDRRGGRQARDRSGPQISTVDGRVSRGALLAGASLIALAAFGAPAASACTGRIRQSHLP
jgi:hypothetical protein